MSNLAVFECRCCQLLCIDFPTCTANRRGAPAHGGTAEVVGSGTPCTSRAPSSAHVKLGQATWSPQKELVGRAECGGIAVFSLSLSLSLSHSVVGSDNLRQLPLVFSSPPFGTARPMSC
jgi:hypothetical protein